MTSRNKAGGFTLLEIIVVIAVLGLVMAVLSVYAPPRSHWLQTVAAANKVAAAMHGAQTAAISSGQPVPLHLPTLPGWLAITVTAPAAGIVFEPDGSVTGGNITLQDGKKQINVTADWLTGRIAVATQ